MARLGKTLRRLQNGTDDVLPRQSDASRVLELCYLSQEPGLMPVIRVVAALPDDVRVSLLAFLSRAELSRVRACLEPDGGLRLTASRPRDEPAFANRISAAPLV